MVNAMKKTFRKLFCLVLIVAMLFTSVCCIAYGKEKDLVYVSLGDSIADGIGLPENPLSGTDQPNKDLVYCNKTAGAYPVLIAEQLGIKDKDFYQLGCAGMRTVELRYCLDPTYRIPNKNTFNFQEDELEKYVLGRFNYQKLVKKADIITLNMCANDIAAYTMVTLESTLASYGVSEKTINNLTCEALKRGEYFGALCELLNYASKLNGYSHIASVTIKALNDGYNTWTKNWDAICKIIYKLNPDVQLVCLGLYNPFSEMKLTDDSLFGIGSALDSIILAVDSWCISGSKYSDKYTYVSIFGIESLFEAKNMTFTDENFFDNLTLYAHPSLKGHKQIADRVVKQIEAAKYIPAPVTTFMSVSKSIIKTVSNYAAKIVTKMFSIFK